MKKKILVVENSVYVTGGFNAIISLVDRMEHAFEFHFFVPEKSQTIAILKEKGYRVSALRFLEISRSLRTLAYFPRLYLNSRRIERYMRQESIEILHVNDLFNMTGCMVKWMNPSIKLIYHVRLLKSSYIAPIYSLLTRQIRKYSDRIICVSQAVRTDFGPCLKTTVVYDSPDLKTYSDWQGLRCPTQLKILYVGNYIRGKGQEYGLQAFAQLSKKYPNSTIKFAGSVYGASSASFKKHLKDMAERLGVSSRTEFCCYLENVEQEMTRHDVVLNLSESESFSLVCLEAMLCGVPLVAANSGGPGEITDQGKMAILVENRNSSAAAEALIYVVEHAQESKERARKAKEWARVRFDPNIAKAEFIQLYLELTTHAQAGFTKQKK